MTDDPLSGDPLWWLNFKFPAHRHETVLSICRGARQDEWLVTTNLAIWKLALQQDGSPKAEIIMEIW